ncbi:Vacuolar protein sorting-associated protein 51 [Modicella reniformis]|uniref:Vacuolar protein sorting-associated protein 51 homolog n=1 Tax=Modicella reniformis TaxID=1440133 RepID=A0A9P6M8N3_9FUNG|nr:Vacuolar protein sorting-associated protein 51 [Modicella reniformis]
MLAPTDKVSYLNAHYLRQVEGFVVSFRNYYLVIPGAGSGTVQTPSGNSGSGSTGGGGTSDAVSGAGGMVASTPSEDSITPAEQRPPAWVGKDSRVYANLTKEQQEEAAAEVKEAVSEMVGKYLDTVNSFLDYPNDIFSVRPAIHVHVLQSLYLATLSCNGLCQLIGFDSLAMGLIQNWEMHLIRRVLNTVKENFMSRIVKQDGELVKKTKEEEKKAAAAAASNTVPEQEEEEEETSGGLISILKETTVWLHEEAFKKDTIPFLEKCIMTSDETAQFLETTEGRKLFLKNFQEGFKIFWDEVLKEMQHKSSSFSSLSSTSTSTSSSTSTMMMTTTSNSRTTTTSSSTTTSLIMSQLCFQLSNTVVEQIYKTLSKTLFRPGKKNIHHRTDSLLIESYEPPQSQPSSSSSPSSSTSVIPQLQWDCKTVIQACQETGHLLLDGYIARTGNDLSWIIMDLVPSSSFVATTTTATTKDGHYMTMASPPEGVSQTWEDTYKKLNEIERWVILVYGDDGDRLGHRDLSSESIRREPLFKPTTTSGPGPGQKYGHSRGHDGGSRISSFGSNTMNNSRFFETQQRNLLLSNIDKLFSDRVDIFIRCQDLNRTGIMFGIIKILLKAWTEFVRQKTFGRGGFQQVQVDAEFAKVWLWRFATADERWMHSLLEETQQTAFRRCIDPAPLDPPSIETIIHSSER